MDTSNAPFPHFEYNEFALDEDKTNIKLEIKEEFIAIKNEICDAYIREGELALVEDKTNIKFEIKEEFIEIKNEICDTYIREDEQSYTIEDNISSQNIEDRDSSQNIKTEFNINNDKDIKSKVPKWRKERKCSMCDFVTNSMNKLKHHVVNVHNTGAYECANCGYKTHMKHHLKHHLKLKTACQFRLTRLKKRDGIVIPQEYCTKEKSGFKCIYCEYISTRKHMIKRHVEKVHLKLQTNSCLHCEFKTPYKMTFESHMLRNHPDKCDPLQVKIHLCSHCQFNTSNKVTFESHMVRKHLEKCDTSQLKTYSCLHCEFITPYKKTFESHMVRKHPENCDLAQLKFHSCLHCEFKTRNEVDLQPHMMRKHPEKCDPSQLKTHNCLHCEYKTPNKKKFELHMVLKHPEKCDPSRLKTRSCLHCDFKTLYKITLESHMVRKHPEKCHPSQLEKKACHLCGKMYLLNASLQKHMRIEHLNEKEKCCPHMHNAHGEQPGKNQDLDIDTIKVEETEDERVDKLETNDCKVQANGKVIGIKCSKKCDQSQQKTCFCLHCEFKTLYKITLESHMVRKHPEKCDPSQLEKKACHLCGKMYLLNASLQKHMRIEHLNKKVMDKSHGEQPVRPEKQLCQESPSLGIDIVKVEKNEDEGTETLEPNGHKDQIKQEIKIETIYLPSLLNYQEDMVTE